MLSENTERQTIHFFIGVVFVFAFIIGMQPIWEYDIWFHLKIGQWIVQHQQFPTTDIFSSIHSDREWKTFNWLFEIIIYKIQLYVGLIGLRISAALVVLGILGLWLVYFLRQTKNTLLSLMLLVFFLMIYSDRIQIRPHLINPIFEASILLFYQSGGTLKTWRGRLIFFLCALAWSNVHTPCSAIGMCAIWFCSLYNVVLAPYLGRSRNQAWKEMVWPVGLSAIAICCNPYGPQLLWSGVNNITPVFSALDEWKSPLTLLLSGTDIREFIYGATPIATSLFSIVTMVQNRKQFSNERNADQLRTAGAAIAFLIVSQISIRFIYLSIPMIALLLSIQERGPKKIKSGFTMLLTIAFAFILYNHQITGLGGFKSTIHDLKFDIVPAPRPDVANHIYNEAGLSGAVYSETWWGGYLLWFSPKMSRVFSDTRNSYSTDAAELQRDIYDDMKMDSEKLANDLEKTKVDLAVLPEGSFPYSEWPIDHWIRVAHDKNFEVFVNSKSQDVSNIRNWLGLKISASNREIQKAATEVFGERYYLSHATRIADLKKNGSEEAIHKLGLIEKVAGHDEKALEIFRQHLKESPNCLISMREIAFILHSEEKYKEVWDYISEVNKKGNSSPPIEKMRIHIQSHLRSGSLNK